MSTQGHNMDNVTSCNEGQVLQSIVNELWNLKEDHHKITNVVIEGMRTLNTHVQNAVAGIEMVKGAMGPMLNKNAALLETMYKEKALFETELGRQKTEHEAQHNKITAELMQSRLSMEQQVKESDVRAKALRDAENANKRLTEELDASHQQYGTLASQFERMEGQNRKLCEYLNEFRAMITKKGGGSEEIDDNTVIYDYRAITAQIHSIASNFYSEQVSIPASHKLSDSQKELFDPLRMVSGPAQHSYRVRAILSRLVDEWILSKQCFGLDNVEEKTEKDRIENALGMFEQKLLELDSGQKRDTNEWRARTVICASWLCISPSLPEETTHRIYDFMKPLLPSKVTKEIEKQVRTQLNKLCKDAYEFTLCHRRTQDEYRCVSPEKGTILNESIARPQAKESCSELEGAQHDKIALVLSPALVKYPLLEEMIVLEKAHVVVYRD